MKINFYLSYVMFACLLTVASTTGLIYFYDVEDEVVVSDLVKDKPLLKAMLLVDADYEDGGWAESHVRGFSEAVDQIGAISEVHDSVRNDECLYYIDDFAKRGGNIVIAPSDGFIYCLNIATKKYPNIKFLGIISDKLNPSLNLISFYAKAYKIRYLTGIIAGFSSKSDSFGYILAVKTPETLRGLNAYTLGVKLARPNAKVYVYVLGSWYGRVSSQRAMNDLLTAHPEIEVISYHVSEDGIDKYCDSHGLKTISYNISKSNKYPQSNLTSTDWNWGNFYKTVISEANNGIFEPRTIWLGIKIGAVRLGKINKNVPFDAINLVDRKYAEFLLDGKDVFEGPIYNNSGNLQIKHGDKLTNEDLLYRMDWYVDGVEELQHDK